MTGYIAGDALHLLHDKHPDWDYTCLVRSVDKAKLVRDAYPNVRVVLGDLDASELLQKEAARADIVLRMRSSGDAFTTLTSHRRCRRERSRGSRQSNCVRSR